jgi:CubicO group peptidase (beta-lactamase class C family)
MKFHRRTFIKRVGFGAAGLSLASTFPGCMSSGPASHPQLAGGRLARSSPEEQGVASQGILDFLDAAAKSPNEFHSLMVVRHGKVIAEGWWAPYRPAANHMLYSLSKSFTSTAIGFCVAEKRLTISDPVAKFFPEYIPTATKTNPQLGDLKVKHLLTMSVGHGHDTTSTINKEQDWAAKFLSIPFDHPPGTVFLYNSGSTYMLSAIVQKVSGRKTIDYLRPRLFDPLEIYGMTWETCPRGINTGGWGLSVPTEGLAKFGQFYLQKGKWNGHQLLPAAWVEEATTFKIQQPAGKGEDLEQLKKTSAWHQGYCYQFWRCTHNAFRGDGAFGQFCIVMPDQDAVVIITSESSSMATDMDMVWDHILPAMKDAPLPADSAAQSALRNRLASLTLPLTEGRTMSATAARIGGRTFRIDSNSSGVEEVSVSFPNDDCVFRLADDKGHYVVQCGMGKWVDGICNVPGTPPHISVGNLRPSKVAANARWKDADTLEMTWRYYETVHHDTVTCRFDGDTVTVTFLNSIPQPQHKENRPVLHGKMVA